MRMGWKYLFLREAYPNQACCNSRSRQVGRGGMSAMRPSSSHKRSFPFACLQAECSVDLLCGSGSTQVCSAKVTSFVSSWTAKMGSIKDAAGSAVSWDAFWAPDSRYLDGGKARLRLALHAPDSTG